MKKWKKILYGTAGVIMVPTLCTLGVIVYAGTFGNRFEAKPMDATVSGPSAGEVSTDQPTPTSTAAADAEKASQPLTETASESSTAPTENASTEETQTESASTSDLSKDLSLIVHWSEDNGFYHYYPGCEEINSSENIITGTLQESMNSGISDPCPICANG